MSTSLSTSSLSTPSLTAKAGSSISNAVAATSIGTANAGTGNPGTSAAAQLGANEQTFLKLLMTQIRNQDPTSPMDTNQFTTELVQFSGVEQQINTNTALTSLIQLTQSGQLLQSSSLVGHKVMVDSPTMPVQSGTGAIQFDSPTAGPVTVTVYNAKGASIRQDTVDARAGVNTWTWNAGAANQPDGTYKVTATTKDGKGGVQAVPFSVVGTATGLSKSGSSLTLRVGALSTDVSKVQSIVN